MRFAANIDRHEYMSFEPGGRAIGGKTPAAFPAEGIASFFSPKCRAMVTASESPRALNDPVGFRPSSLMNALGYSQLESAE